LKTTSSIFLKLAYLPSPEKFVYDFGRERIRIIRKLWNLIIIVGFEEEETIDFFGKMLKNNIKHFYS
jgi:hypothetical protein